ncbi:MAG: hypothetical protein ABJB10_03285 [Mesorhizobium sp.]
MIENAHRDADDGDRRKQPAEAGGRLMHPVGFSAAGLSAGVCPMRGKQIIHVNLHPPRNPWPPAGRAGRGEVDIFARTFFSKEMCRCRED